MNENHIKTATQSTISKSDSERFVIKFIDYANSLFRQIHNRQINKLALT